MAFLQVANLLTSRATYHDSSKLRNRTIECWYYIPILASFFDRETKKLFYGLIYHIEHQIGASLVFFLEDQILKSNMW